MDIHLPSLLRRCRGRSRGGCRCRGRAACRGTGAGRGCGAFVRVDRKKLGRANHVICSVGIQLEDTPNSWSQCPDQKAGVLMVRPGQFDTVFGQVNGAHALVAEGFGKAGELRPRVNGGSVPLDASAAREKLTDIAKPVKMVNAVDLELARGNLLAQVQNVFLPAIRLQIQKLLQAIQCGDADIGWIGLEDRPEAMNADVIHSQVGQWPAGRRGWNRGYSQPRSTTMLWRARS